MFYVYIIYSAKLDRYYIGQCQDKKRRLDDHNNSRSTYTKTGKPWIFKWSAKFHTCEEAITEESRLKKKKSRKYIEWLISSGD